MRKEKKRRQFTKLDGQLPLTTTCQTTKRRGYGYYVVHLLHEGGDLNVECGMRMLCLMVEGVAGILYRVAHLGDSLLKK